MKPKQGAFGLGDVIAVPLEQGGWGAVVIARWSELPALRRKQLLMYGVDRIWQECPSADEVAWLKPTDACMFYFANARGLVEGLVKGSNQNLGQVRGFRKEQWPSPVCRYGDSSDGDPLEVLIVEVWGGGTFSAREYTDCAELAHLPVRTGLGWGDGTGVVLDYAVRRHHPRWYCPISEESIAVWTRIYEKLRRDGLLAKFEADGWYYGGKDRTRDTRR